MANTVTIQKLPWKRLPQSDKMASISVTVWFFIFLIFSKVLFDLLLWPRVVRRERERERIFSKVLFDLLLRLRVVRWERERIFSEVLFDLLLRLRVVRRKRPTWEEFTPIMVGTMLLTFWYLITFIDRWIHWVQCRVTYGYVLLVPLWEFNRIASSLMILWGTYRVTWKELERRFPKSSKYWWLTAKLAIFVTGLIGLFYCMLYVAEAGAWLHFASPATISDIANKTVGFEIALVTLFFAFGLLTVTAATTAIIRASSQDGRVTPDRVVFFSAALLLLARSAIECGLTIHGYLKAMPRPALQPTLDISYGLVTALYLTLMSVFAWHVAEEVDRGGDLASRVRGWVRFSILNDVHKLTAGGRRAPPPFAEVLASTEEKIDEYVRETEQGTHVLWRECINGLRKKYGRLNPQRRSAAAVAGTSPIAR